MPSHKLSLSPNLDQRVKQYASAHEEMGINDALRELITMGLSVSPTDDATLAAKQRAFNTVRVWAFNQLSEKISEIAQDAEKQLGNFRREPT